MINALIWRPPGCRAVVIYSLCLYQWKVKHFVLCFVICQSVRCLVSWSFLDYFVYWDSNEVLLLMSIQNVNSKCRMGEFENLASIPCYGDINIHILLTVHLLSLVTKLMSFLTLQLANWQFRPANQIWHTMIREISSESCCVHVMPASMSPIGLQLLPRVCCAASLQRSANKYRYANCCCNRIVRLYSDRH